MPATAPSRSGPRTLRLPQLGDPHDALVQAALAAVDAGVIQIDDSFHSEREAVATHWMQNRGWPRAELPDIGHVTGREGDAPAPNIETGCIPFPPVNDPAFTFVDLFAGIGGIRLGLQAAGGRCVFSSEWDAAAKDTYYRNFGEYPFGDIRKITALGDSVLDRLVPDHDVLAAGFPCQPFSRAGVSSRNHRGTPHGFACEAQGTLFFDILTIAAAKRPKVLLLENVRNIERHDGGRTLDVIRRSVENDLGYRFHCQVLDSSSLVPQRRQRCYMVCLRDAGPAFSFPVLDGAARPLRDALEELVPPEYTISERLWNGHIKRTSRNIARGTGFTAYEADLDRPANTLVSRYGKDGKECLIPQVDSTPRMLTPRECARLQGFPETFVLPASRAAAYRQFGNSVAVPVITRLGEQIRRVLEDC